MTRIITDKPTIEELDKALEIITPETPSLLDNFGINLYEILLYARDGLQQRDNNIAFAEEMERQENPVILHPNDLSEEQCKSFVMLMDKEGAKFWETQKDGFRGALQDDLASFGEHRIDNVVLKADEFDPSDEINYALQLEGRAYGQHNPDMKPGGM